MARRPSEREDFLAEATALVPRIELSLGGSPATAFIGFRRNGALTVLFDDELMVQFNTAGEVRRAFQQGELVKAEQGRLVGLVRNPNGQEVQLLRQPWDSARTTTWIADVESKLDQLEENLQKKGYAVLGCVAPEGEAGAIQRVKTWLADRPRPLVIARRPNVA